jgi:sigma-E factor negative regulatory protein RseA
MVNHEGAARDGSGCREALSSLIDGELDDAGCRALLERLQGDETARRDWVLLNVACDALRSSDVAALHSGSFVGRVSAALAGEPAIVAPRPRRVTTRLLRRVVLPGTAVAAAAAVLVVVAVPQLRGSGGATPPALVRSPEPKAVPVAVVPPPSGDIVRSAELEAYLQAHRDLATSPLTLRSSDYLRTGTLLAPEPRTAR